jgi:photosystem II stability/assembly factor-like uncharacterized protein
MKSSSTPVSITILFMLLFPSAVLAQYWIDANGIPGPKVALEAARGRILVGTETHDIYYSDDGGVSWSQTQLRPSPLTFNTYALYGRQSEVFAFTAFYDSIIGYFSYYGTNLFHSTDNGMSWTRIVRDSVLIVAISDSGGVFGLGQYHESSDYGFNRYRVFSFDGSGWQPIGASTSFYTLNTNCNFFSVDHANNFIFSAFGSTTSASPADPAAVGLFISTDRGLTWTQHFPRSLIEGMGITHSNELIVGRAAGNDTLGGVFRSTDVGQTWIPLGLTGLRWVRAVVQDTLGNLFVATVNNVYRYLGYYDGWQQADLPSGLIDWPSNWTWYGGTDYFENIESSPMMITGGGTVFACGKVDGVYRSTDHGTSWIPSGPRGEDAFSLMVEKTGKILAGTLGSGIYSSENGGLGWVQIPPDSVSEDVFSLVGDGAMLYAGTDEGVYGSTDGMHWANVSKQQIAGSAYAVSVSNTGSIFAGTNFGVYRSTDHGATWNQSGLSGSGVFFLATAPDGHLYAGTKSNGIFASTDNGVTWRSRGVVREDIEALAVNDSGIVFVGVYGGILRSRNGGISWEEKDFAQSYVYALAFHSSQTVFAGSYDGVYVSYDNGDHWNLLNNRGLGQTFVLSLATDNNGNLYAGTYHGGVYRTVQAFTSVETPRLAPGAFRLDQNYPNPFNPTTTVSFVIRHSSFVTLRVYDVLGREVATLVNEVKQAGDYTVEWKAEGIASGVYFYRLTAGSYSEIKKMLFLR